MAGQPGTPPAELAATDRPGCGYTPNRPINPIRINRHDVIEDPGHEQNQNPRQQGDGNRGIALLRAAGEQQEN